MITVLFREDFERTKNLVANHQYAEVIRVLESRKPVYAVAPAAQKGAYHQILGTAYSKMGNYKAADYHFDMGLAAVPGNFKLKLEMADSYMQRGDFNNAEKALVELGDNDRLEHGGYYRRFLLLSGKFLKLIGDYGGARQSFAQAHRLDRHAQGVSKDVQLMDDFMKATHVRFDRAKGVVEYARHLSYIDEAQTPHGELARTLLKNAAQYFKGADEKVQCYASLSHISMEFGLVADALEYNQKALALDANHPRSLAARIRMLFETGQKEEAMKRYREDRRIILEDARATLAIARTFKFEEKWGIANSLARGLLKRKDADDDTRESAHVLFKVTQATLNRLALEANAPGKPSEPA